MELQSRVEVFRKTPSKIGGDDSAVGNDPSSKDINDRAEDKSFSNNVGQARASNLVKTPTGLGEKGVQMLVDDSLDEN